MNSSPMLMTAQDVPYHLFRADDNGARFLIATCASREEAEMIQVVLPLPTARDEAWLVAVTRRQETDFCRVFLLEHSQMPGTDKEFTVLTELAAAGRSNWGPGCEPVLEDFASLIVSLVLDAAARPMTFTLLRLAWRVLACVERPFRSTDCLMDVAQVLADLLSRDVSRIRDGCFVVTSCWDRKALRALGTHIPEILAGTQGVEWGGAFMSNESHLKFAIERMNYARDEPGCLCGIFRSYFLASPEREQERGHVTVEGLDKELRQYQVSCRHCGAFYKVDELDYHYTWWQWVLVTGGWPAPLES